MSRWLVITAISSISLFPHHAEASCEGGPNDRRLFVGQPPDLYFTAGVAATKYVPQVFVNYDNSGETIGMGDDCGAVAASTISGVSVEDTYCFWDQPNSCLFHLPGENSADDHASSYSHPASYRNYIQNWLRAIPVFYDGTAPAGTFGTINIGPQDELGNLLFTLVRANVYITSGTAPNTWFSTSGNVSKNSLVIDSPFLNGNPGAGLFITNVYNGAYWPHPTAVTYDGTLAKWKIRNEDGTTMQASVAFNVRVDPSATWVAPCNSPCADHNYLIIDNPVSNGNPYATIIVSPRTWGSKRFTHPFAVSYVSPHWEIITTDGQNFGVNTSRKPASGLGFYVKIIGASQDADDNLSGDASGFTGTTMSNGVGVDINGPHRVSGNTKYLSDFCWTTKGSVPLIVTQNQTALPRPAPRNYNNIDPDFFGVGVSGTTMTVFHETSTKSMPATSAFNVWGPYRTDCPPN